jgi:hypothetical protein
MVGVADGVQIQYSYVELREHFIWQNTKLNEFESESKGSRLYKKNLIAIGQESNTVCHWPGKQHIGKIWTNCTNTRAESTTEINLSKQ